MEEKLPLDSVSRAILIAATILGTTWRFKITSDSGINPFDYRDKGIIYCFWHSQILPLGYIFRGIGVKALISSSADGERASAVAQRWKHETIRGSSSRHGISALRQCVRELDRKKNLVLVPDGPRGPREIVKPGVGQIAIMSGAPVFPVSVVPDSSWKLRSWDRFLIPKPFTRIEIHIGNPVIPQSFAGNSDPVSEFNKAVQKALTI
jgi:lysophospholipid acyltransferase (LPLAT)-like uncharacterized protein